MTYQLTKVAARQLHGRIDSFAVRSVMCGLDKNYLEVTKYIAHMVIVINSNATLRRGLHVIPAGIQRLSEVSC